MEKLIKIEDLSPEQVSALQAQIEARQQAEKERVMNDRNAYKRLVGETVDAVFPGLLATSAALEAQKGEVYRSFERALEMKGELYDVKDGQRSHTFINGEGTRRITIGYYVTDGYDDTVNEGIAKVREAVGGYARDENSAMLVEAIMKLLSRDQKGNLKASRVMQLRKMADESGNATFIEGVHIIEQAYRPERTKQFVRAEQKNGMGAWVSVPLGMTEA